MVIEEKNVSIAEVSPALASDEVLDELVFHIASGRTRVGEKLPTIEQLATSTGVSRPVVGTAYRILADHDVVDLRRGAKGGAWVRTNEIPLPLLRSIRRLSRCLREGTLMDVVEARRPIEERISQLASERLTEASADKLRAIMSDLRRIAPERNDKYLYIDHRFHYYLGVMAQSEVLARMQHRLLVDSMVRIREYGLLHKDHALVIEVHQAILDAIVAQDPVAITSATDRHWATSSGVFPLSLGTDGRSTQ